MPVDLCRLSAAVLLAIAVATPSLAQEATTAPAATPDAAPAEPAVAAAAEPAAPTPISTDIIKPEFVETLRQQLQQPVTILSVNASNKRHEGVQQAEIDTLDTAWKTEAKAADQPLIAEILSSPLSSYLLYTQ